MISCLCQGTSMLGYMLIYYRAWESINNNLPTMWMLIWGGKNWSQVLHENCLGLFSSHNQLDEYTMWLLWINV